MVSKLLISIVVFDGQCRRNVMCRVNDLFLGPGEVSVYEDDLKDWTFDFSFDKVLGFRRHPVDQRRSSNCDGSERDEPLHSHAQVAVVGNRVPL